MRKMDLTVRALIFTSSGGLSSNALIFYTYVYYL